ncbi:MAG: aminopeptidase, partial [Methanomicrobia archaeon]|nr:aminopeptidase [Methanomicrobia archaeon]
MIKMLSKLANIITGYSVEIKEGDLVMVQSSILSAPLIEKIYENLIMKGANVEIKLEPENISDIYFKYASEKQLKYVSPVRKYSIEKIDIFISIWADYNTKNMNNVDPGRMATRVAANAELNKIFMEREAKGELQWTLAPYPTQAMAQEAGMSLIEYRDFVYGTLFLDKDNPIEEWKKLSVKQEKVTDYLNKKSEMRFVGEDTDLTLSTKGRKWINCDGKKNLPDGEVFTGPIEDSANGKIRFTYPGIYMGKEIEDIKLTFKDGEVIDAKAAKGEDLLKKLLEIDGAKRIGEIAIGTNYGVQRFTKNMLFDEKMGGTMHLALGRAIPESGGKNFSSIHWDI